MSLKNTRKNVIITPLSRGCKHIARKDIEQHLSENMRQSFAAEGVYFSPEKWKKLQTRTKKIRQIRSSVVKKLNTLLSV
jgi:hypothetical protein